MGAWIDATRWHGLARRRAIGATVGVVAAATLLALAAPPPAARACGGFFCDRSSGLVNQSAERIVFQKEADGTVWATIEVRYQGDAASFAWVIPVEGRPEVQLGSTQWLDALQQATNPSYLLFPEFEDCDRADAIGCGASPVYDSEASFGAGPSGGEARGVEDPEVDVLARERLGPYDYVIISVSEEGGDPAAGAIAWLRESGYDVYEDQAATLRPYLQAGMNLLAFRLAKDAPVGAIRPVRIEFGRGLPSIPIRPTAIAANQDMPIMVFLLGPARGVPANYALVEMNHALVDWFDPSNNYLQVVTAAVDEAGGQAFVTEFAGPTEPLRPQAAPESIGRAVTRFRDTLVGLEGVPLVAAVIDTFAGWEGLDEVLRQHTTLDAEQRRRAASCRTGGGCLSREEIAEALPEDFDADAFVADVERQVAGPLDFAARAMATHPYLTRLLTTMSPEEMTRDPLFDYNPDLPDVSNAHRGTVTVTCVEDRDPWGEPWVAELEGEETTIVRGERYPVWPGTDPAEADAPAILRARRVGSSGEGEVFLDRSEEAREAAARDEGGCRLGHGSRARALWLLQLGLLGLWLGARRRRRGGDGR